MAPSRALAVPILLVLVLAGCAGDDAATDPVPVDGEVLQDDEGQATGSDQGTTITIQDFAFDVGSSVPAGGPVTIRNEDGAGHTVTAEDGGFDVTIPGGASETIDAPDAAGTYAFVCTIHPSMSGSLTVE